MAKKQYKYPKPPVGKGSHRREGANDEAYREGYDRIFGPRLKCPHRQGETCLRQEKCEAMLRCLYPPKT